MPQLKAFPRKGVGPSGLRAAHDAAAVAPELPHAEVVDVEEEDVGTPSRRGVDIQVRVEFRQGPSLWDPCRGRGIAACEALPKDARLAQRSRNITWAGSGVTSEIADTAR